MSCILGRFGQTTPALVDFLRDILRRSPEGGQILKVTHAGGAPVCFPFSVLLLRDPGRVCITNVLSGLEWLCLLSCMTAVSTSGIPRTRRHTR